MLLLALPFLSSAQETIKMYGSKISAADITGTSKFGPKNERFIFKLMADPVIKSSSDDNAILDMLGRFVIADLRSPSALINMTSNRKTMPFLDETNFDYYQDWAIPELLDKDPSISRDTDYLDFKKRLSKLITVAEKKALLTEEKYSRIKSMLEKSRLDFIEKDFNQYQNTNRLLRK